MSADNLVTLRPQGRFDFNCFRDFRSTYEAALAQDGVKCVVVDLQQVQYIDSAALGILLLLRDKAAAQGAKVELAPRAPRWNWPTCRARLRTCWRSPTFTKSLVFVKRAASDDSRH